MRFFFFRFRFGVSANRGRFTPAKPRSRPCASRNELCQLSNLRGRLAKQEGLCALHSFCASAVFHESVKAAQVTLRKVPNAKIQIRLSTGAVRIIAGYPKSDTKTLT